MVTLHAVWKDAAAAVGLFGGLAGLHVYLDFSGRVGANLASELR